MVTRKNDPMKSYMKEIGQIPLVTRKEEVALAALIAAGDAAARSKLIQSNLRLVVKIAHDFKGIGLPLLDLIAEGNIGLMKAVEKFDPTKGAKFSSYAAWWIKQSMRRALSNQSRTIRVPVQSAGKMSKIKAMRSRLNEELGREPTDSEIANLLDFSERTVTNLRRADLKTFSLQDPIQQGEDGMFQDIIPDSRTSTPDEVLSDVEIVKRVRSLMKHLDTREQLILRLRFGLDGNRPRTLEEVSKKISRTRERVRQIQNQSLQKLKKLIDEEQPVPPLPLEEIVDTSLDDAPEFPVSPPRPKASSVDLLESDKNGKRHRIDGKNGKKQSPPDSGNKNGRAAQSNKSPAAMSTSSITAKAKIKISAPKAKASNSKVKPKASTAAKAKSTEAKSSGASEARRPARAKTATTSPRRAKAVARAKAKAASVPRAAKKCKKPKSGTRTVAS